jgi:hypothetical protein
LPRLSSLSGTCSPTGYLRQVIAKPGEDGDEGAVGRRYPSAASAHQVHALADLGGGDPDRTAERQRAFGLALLWFLGVLALFGIGYALVMAVLSG